jgi:hypothetical protein
MLTSFHLYVGLSSGLFPSGFLSKTLHISVLYHTCHMPSPSHPSLYDCPNHIRWTVQIIKLLTMQFSPVSCSHTNIITYVLHHFSNRTASFIPLYHNSSRTACFSPLYHNSSRTACFSPLYHNSSRTTCFSPLYYNSCGPHGQPVSVHCTITAHGLPVSLLGALRALHVTDRLFPSPVP